MSERHRDKIPGDISNFLDGMTEAQTREIQRVRDLCDRSENILAEDGVPVKLDGSQVVVSQSSVRVKSHYAKVFKESRQERPFNTFQSVYGILFDQTPDEAVVTGDRYFMQYTRDGVISVGEGSDRNVNTSEHVDFVENTLGRLQNEVDCKRRDQEWEKHNRRNRLLDRVGRGTRVASCVSSIIAGVSGAIWLSIELNDDVQDFDEQGIVLTDGIGTSLGETGRVAFSEELRTNPDLRADNLPTLHADMGGNTDDDYLTLADGMRQIVFYKGGAEENCRTIEIGGDETLPLSSSVIAWTDAVTPDGEPRNDEFTVKLETGSVSACWSGQELSSDDDPRVVLDIVSGDK